MLSPQAAALALQVAKGLIKLTRRVDLVVAEKTAVESALSLPAPDFNLRPGKNRMKSALASLLRETDGSDPDPLGSDRQKIKDEIAKGADANESKYFGWVQRYLPDVAIERNFDVNAEFVNVLKAVRPEWGDDREILVAAFHVGPGRSLQPTGYARRIALTVVDVLAEFGGENTALFVRDERLQAVVGAVLRRFGEADLQETTSSRELLRAALGAVLNGVLDARDQLTLGSEWLEALLDALAKARLSGDGEVRDDFVVGLLRGEGLPTLVGAMLHAAAGRLNDDEVIDFKDITADFLANLGDLVADPANTDFKGFFENRWGDILRAGLKSVEAHGPALLDMVLEDEEPLLGAILKRVARDLAETPGGELLTSGTLFGIVNSVAAAAAQNPDLIAEKLDEEWLSALFGSVAETVGDTGIQRVFTREGVETLFKDAFETFAEQPELIVGDNALASALVGGVLESLAKVDVFNARDLASAAIGGALTGISANPGVLTFDYAPLVASLAGKVGTLVKEEKLTGIQGRDIVRAAAESLAENPELFLDAQRSLAEGIVEAVTAAAKERKAGLIAGLTLTSVVSEVINTLARTGRAALKNHSAGDLIGELGKVIDAGFTRAETELGHRMGVSSLPAVIGLLVEAWANGKLGTIDPENSNFKALFAELATRVAS